jgi:ABC-type polysaccharide/polyol phosphate transport system ATPase subunit
VTTGSSAGRLPIGTLVFDEVCKTFRDPVDAGHTIHALVDASFAVAPNESVGVIGPNGAGKSTILKLATGVTAPTSGLVRRAGHAIAVIELGAGMHPDLTGRENIDLLISLFGERVPRTKKHIEQMIEFAGLEAAIDTRTRYYSTGMIARLAFGVAVHAEPEIFLIDEVLSVGDLEFQQRCRDRIFELRAGGTTVIVVSHDLGLIESTCDRALLLVNGKVELDDRTDTVVRRYLGHPARDLGEAFEVTVDPPMVVSGSPMVARFPVAAEPVPATVRLDIVIPTPPDLEGTDRAGVVVGTGRIEGPASGPLVAELGTVGLPSGRYELHVTPESADGRELGIGTVPFVVTGSPGPFAIRLPGRTLLDGVEVGAS